MALNTRHRPWLLFVKKVIDVAVGYSKEDLWAFRSVASRENPSLVPLVEEYLRLLENSETNFIPQPSAKGIRHRKDASAHHLFDLLREKKFFPQNLDLARFASRVVPGMRTYRFDKMSRSDIAARIIEYLETSDLSSRDKLEESMRDAMRMMKRGPTKDSDRRSFLSRWEKIIKGIEL